MISIYYFEILQNNGILFTIETNDRKKDYTNGRYKIWYSRRSWSSIRSSTGWTKELNLISWNNREAKYDLRDWAPDHAKMGKGITLSIDELRQLKNLLNNMDI